MTGLAIWMPHLEKLGSHVMVINYEKACVSPEALSPPPPLLLNCVYTLLSCYCVSGVESADSGGVMLVQLISIHVKKQGGMCTGAPCFHIHIVVNSTLCALISNFNVTALWKFTLQWNVTQPNIRLDIFWDFQLIICFWQIRTVWFCGICDEGWWHQMATWTSLFTTVLGLNYTGMLVVGKLN